MKKVSFVSRCEVSDHMVKTISVKLFFSLDLLKYILYTFQSDCVLFLKLPEKFLLKLTIQKWD